MRIRTGHKPTDWTDNVPEVAHPSPASRHIPAENVGHMRPILRYGPVFHEAKTGTDGWRQTQNAEAAKRYRQRKTG